MLEGRGDRIVASLHCVLECPARLSARVSGVAVSSASGVGVASTASTTGSALLAWRWPLCLARQPSAAVASGVGRFAREADITRSGEGEQ